MSHQYRNTLIKLAIFAVVAIVITISVIASLLDLKIGESTKSYHAIFSNVIGLQSGDVVRIAGVEVGKVNGVHLNGKTYQATVDFTVESSEHLTTTSTAIIDFENLLGQRYLGIVAGPSGGQPLRGGATIPEKRTNPGLDLTTVFSGFQPVLNALNPAQINQLTASIIAVFQGQAGAINTLLSQTGTLTANLSQRQSLIYSVVDNLSSLLTAVNSHDGQIGQLIDGLDGLVKGVAGQRSQLNGALSGLSSLTTNLSGVLGRSQPYLDQDISGLEQGTAELNNNQNGLNTVIDNLAPFLSTIAKVSSSGNYIATYICDLSIKTSSPAQGSNAPISVKLSNTVPQSPGLPVPQGVVGDQSEHTQVCS
jgi:phospholipid/cholesterol/gamma-HCH transport system substrate-binding protein